MMTEAPPLTVLSYNIHKGFSATKRRFVLKEIRAAILQIDADLVLLQEVQGEHSGHANAIDEWPAGTHAEFLAGEVWPHSVYAKNRIYTLGHHGNAILSKFPITSWSNTDISAHALENRGLLHAVIDWPYAPEPLHAICVHLGLTGRGRMFQIEKLCQFVQENIPTTGPLLLGGDFNDWSLTASKKLARTIHAREIFKEGLGRHARTFPSWMPVLHLDRVYIRELKVERVEVLGKGVWRSLSDHAALLAVLRLDRA